MNDTEDLRTLLARAGATAATSRQRRLLALVGSYLDGERDRVHVLARDHLADHPDDLLAAFLAHLTRSPT